MPIEKIKSALAAAITSRGIKGAPCALIFTLKNKLGYL
jgi:hypothetical protein